jgi:fumarate reductase subunit C
MNVSLYVWQRATAALLAPMVAVHLAVMFYATRHGMTGPDILARTRGNFGWATFYGLFVVAASIHAAIGLRSVLSEWGGLKERAAGGAAAAFGVALFGLGMRAVAAVTLP